MLNLWCTQRRSSSAFTGFAHVMHQFLLERLSSHMTTNCVYLQTVARDLPLRFSRRARRRHIATRVCNSLHQWIRFTYLVKTSYPEAAFSTRNRLAVLVDILMCSGLHLDPDPVFAAYFFDMWNVIFFNASPYHVRWEWWHHLPFVAAESLWSNF